MKFFDLKKISEQYMDIINPISPEKIVLIGKILGLNPSSRVIDFGCGFGEVLALWAEQFGISGVGVDIREYACERARQRISNAGLAGRLAIACGDGAKFPYERNAYDVAVCTGASFIWSGFAEAIGVLRTSIRPGGRVVIGEAYWLTDQTPSDYRLRESEVYNEYQLLQMMHEEGYDLEYMVRASNDDWDRYEAGNWYGLVRWIAEHPDHPERQQVIDHLHESQEEYLRYARQYFGWAIYILSPLTN